SAVVVFVASAILHMVLKYHQSDYEALPDEERILSTMREAGVEPGFYSFPHAEYARMKDPEVVERFERGPVGLMSVVPDGPPALGKQLLQWFVFAIVVGIFAAYLTGRTLAPGAEYFEVFRVAGTTAFLAYGLGQIQDSIWGGVPWSLTAKNVFDGLIYGLLVGGSFAGFWPGG
ncbi:MAG: hypothetical protein R3326_07065, partial [Gemmatimonadota bacterium]|nr:hypothetical protein [Gemmatimonadota bacterium]